MRNAFNTDPFNCVVMPVPLQNQKGPGWGVVVVAQNLPQLDGGKSGAIYYIVNKISNIEI